MHYHPFISFLSLSSFHQYFIIILSVHYQHSSMHYLYHDFISALSTFHQCIIIISSTHYHNFNSERLTAGNSSLHSPVICARSCQQAFPASLTISEFIRALFDKVGSKDQNAVTMTSYYMGVKQNWRNMCVHILWVHLPAYLNISEIIGAMLYHVKYAS